MTKRQDLEKKLPIGIVDFCQFQRSVTWIATELFWNYMICVLMVGLTVRNKSCSPSSSQLEGYGYKIKLQWNFQRSKKT